MSLRRNGELAPFNYEELDPVVADRARAIAIRVRSQIRKTVGVVISIGQDLHSIKERLSHGQFIKWLHSEFEWSPRTAENFMNVAIQFGSKSEIISQLDISPTAAYLLAAPSTPAAARSDAIRLGEEGKKVTPNVVRKLVARHRVVANGKEKEQVPERRLEHQLKLLLHRVRRRWDPENLERMADLLVKFARSIH